jgi:mannose-6-phosphate isomerase
LLKQSPEKMLGKLVGRFDRFPLLLKFLDAKEKLSVQVHPSDQQTNYLPVGEHGKTEAWVVLETGLQSFIYAGLKPATTADDLRQGLANKSIVTHLNSFRPETGDCILLKAGTIHSLGDLVVFEVQENSDVTFRLYDWDRLDAKTGQPRALQVDEAMACIELSRGAVGALEPVVEAAQPVLRERLLLCEHFGLWRFSGEVPFMVGVAGIPRVLVCLEGEGHLEHEGVNYPLRKGETVLLPAVVGACLCRPHGGVHVLEISLPEGA